MEKAQSSTQTLPRCLLRQWRNFTLFCPPGVAEELKPGGGGALLNFIYNALLTDLVESEFRAYQQAARENYSKFVYLNSQGAQKQFGKDFDHWPTILGQGLMVKIWGGQNILLPSHLIFGGMAPLVRPPLSP